MSRSMMKSTSALSMRRSKSFRKDFSRISLCANQLISKMRDYEATPPLIRINSKPIDEESDKRLPCVTFSTARDIEEIQRITAKRNQMQEALLDSLRYLIPHIASLKELKMEYCGLGCGDVEVVAGILQENQGITYLSLNGNRNTRNFHTLLRGTGLQVLSLQCCCVDDDCAALLAEELRGEVQTLLYLNLAGNLIGSRGIRSLADCLRCNRCLTALNIAGNYVSESDLMYMFHPFARFALRHSEIVFRRRKRTEYLLNFPEYKFYRKEQPETPSVQEDASFKIVESINTFNKTDSASLTKSKADSSSFTKSKTSEITESKHPFVADSTPEDGEIFCSGNNHLAYLNISFNEITESVVEAAIKVVRYQKETLKGGLLRIVAEGNFNASLEEILRELKTTLAHSETSSFKGSKSARSSVSFTSKQLSE